MLEKLLKTTNPKDILRDLTHAVELAERTYNHEVAKIRRLTKRNQGNFAKLNEYADRLEAEFARDHEVAHLSSVFASRVRQLSLEDIDDNSGKESTSGDGEEGTGCNYGAGDIARDR